MACFNRAFAWPPSPNGPLTAAADFLNDLKEADPRRVLDGGVIGLADPLPDHHGSLICQLRHTLSLAQLIAQTRAAGQCIPHWLYARCRFELVSCCRP